MPPIFNLGDRNGAFPRDRPLTYLHLTEAEVRALRAQAPPPEVTWFHATSEEAACAAALYGLVPSCWRGGDSCCVFGYSFREEIPLRRRRDWIVEVHSRALPGQLKAWWVPPQAIHGAWHHDRFHPATDLRERAAEIPEVRQQCGCDLALVTAEEIARWRQVAAMLNLVE
jgi:hypothetical protein